MVAAAFFSGLFGRSENHADDNGKEAMRTELLRIREDNGSDNDRNAAEMSRIRQEIERQSTGANGRVGTKA